MKYTLDKKKPNNKQVIVFKTKTGTIPEVGIWEEFDNDIKEIYVPSNDDVEQIVNVEWWMEIPE